MDDSQAPRADQRCAVCGRQAPSSTIVRGQEHSPKVAAGWVDFAGSDELVIDMPYPEPSTLPLELIDAVSEFAGVVRVEPDPQVEVASVREVEAGYVGTVCPECYRNSGRIGWDSERWLSFLSGRAKVSAERDGDDA